MDTVSTVREIVAPLVAEAGADLYDVELERGTLRISVDRTGGVDLQVIGRLSREISRALDEADPIAGPFTLEVSSPGLERPLRTPEHFARSIGAEVTVKTKPGVEGDRRIRATLVAVDDTGITLAPQGAEPGATRHLSFTDVERARTVFEWGPAPKPGGPKNATSATRTKARS